MDFSSNSLEPLESLRQFLRAEGYYATAEALASEIKSRFPEGSSPTGSAQELHRAAQVDEYNHRVSSYDRKSQNLPAIDPQPSHSTKSLSGYCTRTKRTGEEVNLLLDQI